MDKVEITVVNNGYIVNPSHYTPSNQINVFESFASLNAWLKKNLSTPAVAPAGDRDAPLA